MKKKNAARLGGIGLFLSAQAGLFHRFAAEAAEVGAFKQRLAAMQAGGAFGFCEWDEGLAADVAEGAAGGVIPVAVRAGEQAIGFVKDCTNKRSIMCDRNMAYSFFSDFSDEIKRRGNMVKGFTVKNIKILRRCHMIHTKRFGL